MHGYGRNFEVGLQTTVAVVCNASKATASSFTFEVYTIKQGAEGLMADQSLRAGPEGFACTSLEYSSDDPTQRSVGFCCYTGNVEKHTS